MKQANHLFSLLMIILLFSACSSSRPDNLGVTNGQLLPCPESPNCVSTQSDTADKSYMAAWSYQGDQAASKAKLLAAINQMSGTEVVTDKGNYVHVEFTTKIMRFIDDVEFIFDNSSQKIHFRSASRLGHSDLGANSKRMTKLAELYTQ